MESSNRRHRRPALFGACLLFVTSTLMLGAGACAGNQTPAPEAPGTEGPGLAEFSGETTPLAAMAVPQAGGSGTIKGKVTSGNAVGLAEIRVLAIPADGLGQQKTAFTDNQGNYTLHVDAGTCYVVRFVPDGEQAMAYHDVYHEDTQIANDADPVCVPAIGPGGAEPSMTVDASLSGIDTPTSTPEPEVVQLSVSVDSDCAVIHTNPITPAQLAICWLPTRDRDPDAPPAVAMAASGDCTIVVTVTLPDCGAGDVADVTAWWSDEPGLSPVSGTATGADNTYIFELPAAISDAARSFTIRFSWTCGGAQMTGVSQQSILLGLCDPGGHIRADGGTPVSGDSVTLYVDDVSKIPDDIAGVTPILHDCRVVETRTGTPAPVPGVTPAVYWNLWSGELSVAHTSSTPTAGPDVITDQSNPVTTNGSGAYGWLAQAGRCYYVVVNPTSGSRPTAVSPLVGTHPTGTPVADLDLDYSRQ